jgi:hypothetical protein
MRTWRAIGLGVLVWAAIFIEISITMIGLKLANPTAWIIHYIFLIPLMIFVSWIYYSSKSRTNGFLLGIVILIVGIIFDMIITVPFFVKSYLTYFSNWYMIVGFMETIVIVGLYDLWRR